jgi:hypothetical protein
LDRPEKQITSDANVHRCIGPDHMLYEVENWYAPLPGDPARFHPCALERAKTFSPARTPDGQPLIDLGFQIYPGMKSKKER